MSQWWLGNRLLEARLEDEGILIVRIQPDATTV